jgi:hypothetical protein
MPAEKEPPGTMSRFEYVKFRKVDGNDTNIETAVFSLSAPVLPVTLIVTGIEAPELGTGKESLADTVSKPSPVEASVLQDAVKPSGNGEVTAKFTLPVNPA